MGPEMTAPTIGIAWSSAMTKASSSAKGIPSSASDPPIVMPTAVDSNLKIYVSNHPILHASSITFYAAGANGNVKPLGTVQGKKTELYQPVGIAIR